MIVKSLKLNQFRNYESLQLSFDKGTNLFYGNNAQGKTNILEAVYLCGTTKSHKGSKDREMIRFGEEEAHIRMAISRSQSAYEIDMHLKTDRRSGGVLLIWNFVSWISFTYTSFPITIK